jgi:group I intron endonuclease
MDRKALIRQYKETRRPMGIYCVRNTVNGKSLIGTSVDLPSMLNRQRAALRMGTHTNRALQKDLNEYGIEAFEVEVLDTLTVPEQADYDPTADLRTLEQMWLDKLSPFGERGYNPEPKRTV